MLEGHINCHIPHYNFSGLVDVGVSPNIFALMKGLQYTDIKHQENKNLINEKNNINILIILIGPIFRFFFRH